MGLNCAIRQRNDVTILDLTGLLSLGDPDGTGAETSVILRDKVRELAEAGQKKILLNLAAVRFVDSSGAGQLVGALTSARTRGAELKLLNPTSQVKTLLKIIRLDSMLDILDDEEKALLAFGKRAAAAS
jgi:anti-sigma B factor antagonist